MPLPRAFAKANRFLLNPVIRRIADRIPPLAVLIHHGRTSGKEYRTPIMAFPADGDFVIALTYGRNTDWERNIRASGEGQVVYRGRRHTVRNLAFITASEAQRYLPAMVRAGLRLGGVTDFVRLEAVNDEAMTG